MIRLIFKTLIIVVLITFLLPFIPKSLSVAFSSEWDRKENECYGSLLCMLQKIEEAEMIPHFRTTRSADALFLALKKAGRIARLGLTDAEGKILVQKVYSKLGLSPQRIISKETSALTEKNNPFSEIFSYRAGQEFEMLDGMLMRWPFDWSAQLSSWAQMVNALASANITIYMWVDNVFQKNRAIRYLYNSGVAFDHVRWVIEKTDSVWMRDYGPQFIYSTYSDEWGVVDFHYYSSRPEDDDTPIVVAKAAQVPIIDRQSTEVVYTEGGNLNHDGLGCVIYSKRTYSNNPGVDEYVIDSRIKSAFQAHMSIVPQDPSLDGTGHVDMFMKIVSENTVIVGQYGADQIDYQVLEDCAYLMNTSTNGAGTPWNVVRIPQPDVTYIYFVIPVVRTYTNSIIANNVVIVPVYGLPTDDEALSIYKRLLPERQILPLNAEKIIAAAGAWHCVVMEHPNPSNLD